MKLQVVVFITSIMSLSLCFSQATIVLPINVKGSVEFDISNINNREKENLGYDHLSVFVKTEDGKNNPTAIQGKYAIKGENLVFSPYFPFEKGITYMVKAKQGNSYISESFVIGEQPRTEQAKVVSVFPSENQLPENLLRFYIFFSSPMKQGEFTNHIQLIDAEGKIDSKAFMEFKQELWSPDGKRLTVLFDPGRIKRGVATNVALGPALEEGKAYQLKISKNWKDVYGQALQKDYIKKFYVTSPYRDVINVAEWKVETPSSTTNALTLGLDRIMDHALLQSMIKVQDDKNNRIKGIFKILENEQKIQFFPNTNWHKGSYRIVFDSRLEDVAGNNLDNLLDENIKPKNQHKVTSYLNFSIK